MTIDELHAKMEAEFKSVRTDMKTEFKSVRTEIQAVRSELESQIRTDGETTRRHFDIVAEQFKDYTRVLADGIGRNSERLDDHEKRVSVLEGRRS